ncbi:MAG: hypothetical protein MUF12_01945 [Sediminibacterium sp.]|nr:hypothetical protein [Sediminibacterium sp.]
MTTSNFEERKITTLPFKGETRNASVNVGGSRFDANTTKGVSSSNKKTVTIGNDKVDVFPWGANNLLPNEMAELLRSNADVLNLMSAKKDFLYGAGIGIFLEEIVDGTSSLIPYDYNTTNSKKAQEFFSKNDLSSYNETAVSHVVDMANLFVNISTFKDKIPTINCIDPTVCRVGIDLDLLGSPKSFVVAADWSKSSVKEAKNVPNFTQNIDFGKAGEYIYHVKPSQAGQFFYGYANWWSVSDAIKVANRLWNFHSNGLDTQYNAAFIVRVANDYFKQFGTDYEGGEDKFRDDFWDEMDNLLSGQQGTNRIIADECAIGPNGMIPYIEIESIQRGLKGNEYLELYEQTILAFANASGILSNIAGVSNGKVMGGSGSELRVSAEFQQQYRTVRERQLILKVLNRVIKNQLELPENAVFAYKNMTLQTLDKNPTGVQKTVSNSQ